MLIIEDLKVKEVEEEKFYLTPEEDRYMIDFLELEDELPEKNRLVYTVTVPANTTEYNIVFETILTTNMTGGQEHSFVIE